MGTGRLAAPLAAGGLEVWGLDASAAMLDRLRTRGGVTAVLGDMRDPAGALPDDAPAFAVVVVAFNTFFQLADEDAQRDCLVSVGPLLAPGGAFVLEGFVPGDDLAATARRVVEPRTVAVDHVVLSVLHHDPDSQRVDHQLVEIRESGIRLRPAVFRYAWPHQLDELAAGAGLRLRDRWGGWRGEPFDDDSTTHVSVYEAVP